MVKKWAKHLNRHFSREDVQMAYKSTGKDTQHHYHLENANYISQGHAVGDVKWGNWAVQVTEPCCIWNLWFFKRLHKSELEPLTFQPTWVLKRIRQVCLSQDKCMGICVLKECMTLSSMSGVKYRLSQSSVTYQGWIRGRHKPGRQRLPHTSCFSPISWLPGWPRVISLGCTALHHPDEVHFCEAPFP